MATSTNENKLSDPKSHPCPTKKGGGNINFLLVLTNFYEKQKFIHCSLALFLAR